MNINCSMKSIGYNNKKVSFYNCRNGHEYFIIFENFCLQVKITAYWCICSFNNLQ